MERPWRDSRDIEPNSTALIGVANGPTASDKCRQSRSLEPAVSLAFLPSCSPTPLAQKSGSERVGAGELFTAKIRRGEGRDMPHLGNALSRNQLEAE